MNIRYLVTLVGALALFLGCVFPVSAGICPFENGGSAGDVNPFAGDPTPSGLPCPFDGGGSAGDVNPFAGDPTPSGLPCPFDGGGSAGDVNPFAGDPTPSGLPCPFDGGGSAGDVNPFAGDPTPSGLPCTSGANATEELYALYGDGPTDTIPLCAFPVNSSDAGTSGIQCGGTDCPLPTDPDGDGLYEDLNGNGMLDFDDLVVLFKYLEWIPGNEPVSLFDFNGNGMMDFDDIVVLFEEI